MPCVWLFLLWILSQERKPNLPLCISYRHFCVATDGGAIEMFHFILLSFCLRVEQRHFFPSNTSISNWHLTFMIQENKGIQCELISMILLSFLYYLDKKFHSASFGMSCIVLSLEQKAKQLEWHLTSCAFLNEKWPARWKLSVCLYHA